MAFRTFFEHAVATSTKNSDSKMARRRTVRRTVQKKSTVKLALALSLSLTLIQSVSGLAVERKIDESEYLLLSDTDFSTPSCPSINQRNSDADVEPLYKLNPKLFITPIYIWGPSSQLQGLRESIGVAIRLNRTLLLPPFLTHNSDPIGGDKAVPVDVRLDIPELRKLISIGFTDDLTCRQSDVVFSARGIYQKPADSFPMQERVKRISAFEKATQMEVLRKDDSESNEILENPFLSNSMPSQKSPKLSGAGMQFSYRSDSLQSEYNSTETCATWLFPFNNYKYPVVWSAKDTPLTSGEQFFYQIVQHTRKPEYIREMASKFLSEKLDSPYMALHYRYDAIEWSNVCARPQKGRKGEVCDVLEKTGSKGLALSLSRFILQTGAFMSNLPARSSVIYVSSPPSEARNIREVMSLAEKILEGEGWNIQIVSTLDTTKYLEENYGDCGVLRDFKSEVISLVEQEIAYRGDYLLFSELSGWSSNVRKDRILDDKYFNEMSVIKLVEDFGPASPNYSQAALYSKVEEEKKRLAVERTPADFGIRQLNS